jgi:hypothetical protein
VVVVVVLGCVVLLIQRRWGSLSDLDLRCIAELDPRHCLP